MRRRTADEYLAQLQRMARARGGRLLSRAYLGDATKLRWRCARGHVFGQIPSGVKQGRWCRLCGWIQAAATHRAPNAARLRRIVARRGGTILSGEYTSCRNPTRFRCAKGHEWATYTASVLNGVWCRRCSNEIRRTATRARVLGRLQKIAHRHGGELLECKYDRQPARYVFRCAKSHSWEAFASTIDQGAWCQACERESYLERLRRIARKRGGALLSRAYVNDRTPLRFRCAEGHEFEQRPQDTTRDHWCTACGRARCAEARKAPARVKFYGIVAERGGAVLWPEYVNSQTRTRFRCAEGHEWETTPNSINSGSWCRACHRALHIRHPERRSGLNAIRAREVRERLDRAVKSHGGEILPPGFVNFKTPLQLRCEHGHTWTMPPDSIQDGAWCPRCKEEALMSELRERAERWGGECLSKSCHSSKDVLKWRCAVGHRFEASGAMIKRGGWCQTCRQLPRGDIERMRKIARERGGECLSDEYVGAAIKLRWRCANGHEWSAPPAAISEGHWCRRCGWQLPYSRARLTIEIMRETAAERGGKCLSDTYHGNKVPLRWRCARGHTWMAHPNRVRQGAWCPSCAHSARGTLDGMRALAVERGGRCLMRSWNNHQKPLRFECARGHRFNVLSGAVKTGVWCPRCPSPSRSA